jgi:FMN reductase
MDEVSTPALTIVGLGGSLAEHSSSLAALKIALQGAAEAGARTEVLDLRQLALPMYVPDQQGRVAGSVSRLCDVVYNANGLIWSSPMYNGTISGAFKNALDWLHLLGDRKPAYLTDKVIGLISTAGGTQGLQVINTMEYVVRALRGWAVPLVMPIGQAWRAFDEHGQALDAHLTEQLQTLGREVFRASCQFALQPPTRPDAARVEAEITPTSDREAESA